MPTHLRCADCKSRYYTAASPPFIRNDTCQKCGGRLHVSGDNERKKTEGETDARVIAIESYRDRSP